MELWGHIQLDPGYCRLNSLESKEKQLKHPLVVRNDTYFQYYMDIPGQNGSRGHQDPGIKKRKYDPLNKTHELSDTILFDFRLQ